MGEGLIQTIDALVERDAELATIEGALAQARRGQGALIVFEGPAGIGKTALLEAALRQASTAGMLIASARCAESEQPFPYGAVRQLLEPVVTEAGDLERARLLEGAAQLAAPAFLGSGPVAADPTGPMLSVVHGLYWLAANLAEEAPVVLLVDDVHWADAPSLRFLAYLARRIEGLPIALLASIRSGEKGSEARLLSELETTPERQLLRPAPLTDAALTELLAREFGEAPETGFVKASAAVTGGNPLLACELARALRSDGMRPTDSAARHIISIGPQSLARATLSRIGRLSADAATLARAIAVLGPDASLPRATALTGLSDADALTAFDVLVAAEVIPSDGRLGFSHPIVQAALYHDVPVGERAILHQRVAALLDAEGAEAAVIANHLLVCRPVGSTAAMGTLRSAASNALAVGAPENAATYLLRALEEGPEQELRADILVDLGRAEQLAGSPDAVQRFKEAYRLTTDPVVRSTVMVEQARLLGYGAEPERGVALLDEALGLLPDGHETVRYRAETTRAALCTLDPSLTPSFLEHLPDLHVLAESGRPGTRSLAFILARWAAERGDSPETVRTLVNLGWADGRYLEDPNVSELFALGIGALVLSDELDHADEIAGRVRSVAQTRGSIRHDIVASAQQALIAARRGDLPAAEADMRPSIERSLQYGIPTSAMATLWYGCDVLLERPGAADLVGLANSFDLESLGHLMLAGLLADVRGRLRYVAGDHEGAIADLRRALKVHQSFGSLGAGGGSSPRSALALMLGPAQLEEASELVAAELEDARRAGLARRIGIALRTSGLLQTDREAAEESLTDAVSLLAGSPARLEHARALVDLGAARRRWGDREAAREPLRMGLDEATGCGALNLAERARTELVMTGARPRRSRVIGLQSLSPGEISVARLAAEGRTSREIAQALFVTTRTVDSHLLRTYKKLGINSRNQLAAALLQTT